MLYDLIAPSMINAVSGTSKLSTYSSQISNAQTVVHYIVQCVHRLLSSKEVISALQVQLPA